MSCSVKSCTSSSKSCKGTDIIFHRLQCTPELRKLLKSSFNDKTKNACVCSKHFVESDYIRDLKSELLGTDKRKILAPGAIPSVNLGDENDETDDSNSNGTSQNIGSAAASNTGISALDSSEASWRTQVGILCRLCAKSDYGCVPIFKGKSVDDEVKMKIEKYLYIEVKEEDGLPDQLCPGCLAAVSAWHVFAEECLKVNTKLKELLLNEENQDVQRRKKGQSNDEASEVVDETTLEQCDDDGDNGDTDIKTEDIKQEIDIEENVSGNTQFENVSLVVVPENLWNDARKSVDPLRRLSFPYLSQHTVKNNEEEQRNTTVVGENRIIVVEDGLQKDSIGISVHIEDIDCPTSQEVDTDDDDDEEADTNVIEQCDVEYADENKTEREYVFLDYLSADLRQTSCGNLLKQKQLNAWKDGTTSKWKPSDKHDAETIPNESEYVICRVCDKPCLRQHINKHMESHGYYCKKCHKISETEEENLKHMEEHKNKYMCELCGKILSSNRYLMYHYKTHLPEEMRDRFFCAICNAGYTNLPALKYHLKFVHSSRKMFLCDTCGKSFSKPTLLIDHLKVHSEDRPYKCQLCDRAFRWPRNLRQHIKNVHTNTSNSNKKRSNFQFAVPMACHVCGSIFKSIIKLTEHINIHPGAKPFKCALCENQFTTAQAHRNHQRIHRDEKPFQCDACDKSFRTNNNLKIHYRLHTNAMPFMCKFCGKSFRRNGGLIKHERIHTGDKRYSCEICSRAFIQKGDRDKHLRTHSKENIK